MVKYIFFDFNGTIIADVGLCLELLNDMLRFQGSKELSLDEYRDVFTFPIKEYYIKAGIDFNKNSFTDLADFFIANYQPRSLVCGLYPNTISTLKFLRNKGYHLVILSASDKVNLMEQINAYQLKDFFDDILGIEGILAESKVQIAKDYLIDKNINPTEILMVGDTIHDLEVSRAIGSSCILVECGHQSKKVLLSGNVPVLKSIADLLNIL